MKKLLLLLVLCIAFISCHNDNFKGLGELKIGSKIDSIPSYGKLDKISDSLYTAEKYELNPDLGYVEDLKVKVKDGKIYHVEFATGKFTNRPFIDGKLASMKKKDDSYEGLEILVYESDNKITVHRLTDSDKKIHGSLGYYKSDYVYYDNKLYFAEIDANRKSEIKKEKEQYVQGIK